MCLVLALCWSASTCNALEERASGSAITETRESPDISRVKYDKSSKERREPSKRDSGEQYLLWCSTRVACVQELGV
jgi:hypothetical protein